MKLHVRMSGTLHGEMMEDLQGPHPFAAERAGFVSGRMGSLGDGGKLILLNRYYAIADDQYIDDPTVGARIGSDAMGSAMKVAFYGRAFREGVFHIHLHDFTGPPSMSQTDRRELPKLVPGFQSVNAKASHGAIILSLDHGTAWVWLPGSQQGYCADSVQVIGTPIGVFERRGTA